MTALALPIRRIAVAVVDLAALVPDDHDPGLRWSSGRRSLFDIDPAKIAIDYNLYVDATRRAVSGGVVLPPNQLAGPYDATPGVILYPPPFIRESPFTLLPWPVDGRCRSPPSSGR